MAVTLPSNCCIICYVIDGNQTVVFGGGYSFGHLWVSCWPVCHNCANTRVWLQVRPQVAAYLRKLCNRWLLKGEGCDFV